MGARGNKAFWQRFAGIYDRAVKRTSKKTYQTICDRIRPKLKPEMYVLELACGTGQLSYPLSGCVQLWEATDFSEAMIEKARRVRDSGSLRFSVQDATKLPYEHDTFDAVVISNALHIMPQPDKALREIRRVLKPGGLLFAPTYAHGGAAHPRARVTLMRLLGFRVYHKWTAGEFRDFLAAAGFRPDTMVILADELAPLCYIDCINEK